jgi:signal peptidase I
MLKDALLRSTDWSGRARRRDLWAFAVLAGLLLAACSLAEVWAAANDPKAPRFVFLLAALLLVPLISLGVRRLHDRGHGGGWLAFVLLPWVGWLLPAYLLLAPSKGRVDAPDTPVGLHVAGGLLAGLVVALVASRMFWSPYWVPSGSMKPTLLPGDYLIVGFADAARLQRGDVVVFRAGLQGQTYVARLIGLPGDRVAMQAGILLLNGQAVIQEDMPPFTEVSVAQGPARHLPRCGNAPVGAGGKCITAQRRETLPGGAKHAVLDLMPDATTGDMPEVTVPQGQYFMLGDNRDDSIDSRFATSTGGMGMVDGASVIGQADRVLFSAAGAWMLAVWNWRAGRYWLAIE